MRGGSVAGMAAVEAADHRDDSVRFSRSVDRALEASPGNPHLMVLKGDAWYGQGNLEKARECYEQAARARPQLAEAWFRLGVLADTQKRAKEALDMYRKAAALSPSPHYLSNLAGQHFQRGEYEAAIAEYGKISEFPEAALRSAAIHRLLGQLAEAREQQHQALEWLNDGVIASRPENELPWYFALDSATGIRVPTRAEKVCYARLELAFTQHLEGNQAAAKTNAVAGQESCRGHLGAIQSLVVSEAVRLAEERPEYKAAGDEFRKVFLVR
jgi:tetratricopeptide (TPR) repeat protein